MLCSHCRFDNPAQMRFCVDCGSPLAALCPQCKAEVLSSYKFCGHCGSCLQGSTPSAHGRSDVPLAARVPASQLSRKAPADSGTGSTPPSEGERKQATVVICELITSGVHGGELEPDVLHVVLNRFFALAQTEVQRYEGTVSRFLGQGFLALFGAPVAHEDHPRRAVLAALGLQQRLAEHAAELEREQATRIAVRMGIDTGAVVVGGVGDTVLGETTRRAGHLQKAASPGTLLVTGATADLVRAHVELEDTEPVMLGDDQRIEVYRIVGASTSGGVASLFRDSRLSPLVGRERELENLERLRRRAAESQGQVVGLVGEAGAGKSRVLHELYRRTFPGRRVSYLRGQCLSYGSGLPYHPFIDMIRKASRINEGDSAAVVTNKLRRSLEGVGTDPASLPYFLRLLGIEEGTDSLAELEPQAIQSRTFAAMRRMLLDAAQRSLVVLEIEDVHWIDATSDDFLSSLIEAMGAARLLVLLTYRSGYQPRWLEKSYATQIPMSNLSSEESHELVAAIFSDSEQEERLEDLGSEILEKAEGNPLFLEELARALLEGEASQDGAIPSSVQGILMARIDRLPEAHKSLLRIASVLGREVSLELLEAIWDDDQPYGPLLEELQRWELIYRVPSEDQEAYFFKHALTQEVAYESLLSDQRRSLHRRAAEALERLHAERLEDAYGRLIYHYPKADDPEKTVHYLTRFALRAARDYSHAEAAGALREALVHAAELPAEDRDRRTLEVLLQLADSLLPLAAFPETLELCLQHAEAVERLGDVTLTARYNFWLAHTYTYLGNQEETRRCAELSIAAAKECDDEATEGKAYYVLGRDGFWSGRFQQGIESSLRAVVLLERADEPWWQGQAYWVAGFNHYVLGQLEEGIEDLERAKRIGKALDDYRLDTSWSLGYFYAALGETGMGIEQCRAGLDGARDPLNTAVAMGFLGYAYLQKQDIEAALECLEDSVPRLREAGMLQLAGWFSTYLGEAYLAVERIEESCSCAEDGLQLSEESSFLFGLGLSQRLRGRVAMAAEENETAGKWLERSRQTFISLGVPLEIAWAELDLARLAAKTGDRGAAQEWLEAASGGFEQLHIPAFLEKAASLGEELGLVAG